MPSQLSEDDAVKLMKERLVEQLQERLQFAVENRDQELIDKTRLQLTVIGHPAISKVKDIIRALIDDEFDQASAFLWCLTSVVHLSYEDELHELIVFGGEAGWAS